jgi:potassium efflux system protein
LLGTVKRIGIRASIVRTFDGADVVVPNGDLISKEVTNWTLSDQVRRRELNLGVAYGTPPEEVLEILAQVVKDHPDVLDAPDPMILFQGFVDGTMRFSLRYWVPIAGSLQTASEVAVAANAALRAAGIRIPVPQREIVIRKSDDEPDAEGQPDLLDGE